MTGRNGGIIMKALKKIATLVLTMVMVLMMVESAVAKEYSWSSTKSPGNDAAVAHDVRMDVYTGDITFKVNRLSGNCSYQIAVASSAYPNQYYINNSQRCVKISRVNGEDNFKVKFTNFDISSESYMYIRCTMEHNASIGETLTASGILYH